LMLAQSVFHTAPRVYAIRLMVLLRRLS
jgi:hypothetical protein